MESDLKLLRPSSSKLLHYGLKFHKSLVEVKDMDPDYVKTFHTEEHNPTALLSYYNNRIKDPPLKVNNISHWDNIKVKTNNNKPPRPSKMIFEQNVYIYLLYFYHSDKLYEFGITSNFKTYRLCVR